MDKELTTYIDGSRAVVVWILAKVHKNVNVTTIMFLMSGDLTGLCLYMVLNLVLISLTWQHCKKCIQTRQ